MLNAPLKWLGGKKWLAKGILGEIYSSHSERLLVDLFTGAINVPLVLMPKKAILNDANPHLINLYRHIKKGSPNPIEMRYDKDYYYQSRERFNWLISNNDHRSPEAAWLFYLLLKCGYNGVCRFSKGVHGPVRFNVPFGKYKDVNFITDFSPYKKQMQGWKFSSKCFRDVALPAGSFAYADPPYTDTFSDYSTGGFNWQDQVDLAVKLSQHDGPVVASNSDNQKVKALYRDLGFTLTSVTANRSVSCNSNRGETKEMLAVRNC